MPSNRLPLLLTMAACAANAEAVGGIGEPGGTETDAAPVATTTEASSEETGLRVDAGARPSDGCSAESSDSIQLLDIEGSIHRLWPETLTVESLGRPDCDGAVLATALTMDRGGTLWAIMVTVDGPRMIYTIDPATLECEATGFVAPAVPHFTMGGLAFVGGEAGGMTESLYVGLDLGDPTLPPVPQSLGLVDLDTMTLEIVGTSNPPPTGGYAIADLTGTGGGGLFGFFSGTMPLLAELSTEDGTLLRSDPLPFEVPASRWAVAQWAGRFWLFTSADEAGSNIVAFDPADGSYEAIGGVGAKVVGAAVSTCAPYRPEG